MHLIRLSMNLIAHMNKSVTTITHHCQNLHVKLATNRPSVWMLSCFQPIDYSIIFNLVRFERQFCQTREKKIYIPDEVVLNEFGILVHPRFHAWIFSVVIARRLTRWYRWRQGDTRTRMYIIGTRCVPLLRRHSAMWLLYAAQMQACIKKMPIDQLLSKRKKIWSQIKVLVK